MVDQESVVLKQPSADWW